MMMIVKMKTLMLMRPGQLQNDKIIMVMMNMLMMTRLMVMRAGEAVGR